MRMRSIIPKLKRTMGRNNIVSGILNRILIIGVMLILSSMFAYAATSIELTTGNFINVFGNLNLSGNNLINAGNVSIKGNLSVDGNVSLDGNTLFVDATGNRVGVGTALPSDTLTIIGSLVAFGSLNATFINATEIRVGANIVQVEKDSFKQSNYSSEYSNTGFKIGNYSSEYAATGFKISNFTSAYDARSDRYGNANYSSEYASTGFKIGNYSSEYASTGYKLSNFTSNLNSVNASISLWNGTTNIYPREITGNVGIGTTSPNYLLQVASGTDGRSVNLSNVLYVNGSSGNVGIGTTSPGATLHIDRSSIGEFLRLSRSGTVVGYFYTDGSSNDTRYEVEQAGSALRFRSRVAGGMTDTLAIKDGNVGIGTTNPNAGTISASPVLRIEGSNPVITFNNTGASRLAHIRLGANGILQFIEDVSNEQRMVINMSSGNVGIGMANPLFKFQVNNGTDVNLVIRPGTDLGAANGVTLESINDANSLAKQFVIYGSDILFLPSGNVGIGTTGPLDKLDVAGSLVLSGGSRNISFNSNAAGNNRAIIDLDSSTNVLRFRSIDSANAVNAAFQMWGSGSAFTTGNVGIGTTTPAATLHSNGTFIHSSVTNSATAFQVQNASGTTVLDVDTSNQRVGIGTTGPSAKVQIQNAAAASISALRIEESSPATTGDVLKLEFFGDGPGDSTIRELARIQAHNIQTGSHHGYLSFWTMQSTTIGERMRIDDGGNVGIGATVPGSRLEVENTGSANDVLLLEDSSGLCEAQPTTTDLTWSCSSDEKLKTNIKPSRFNALAYVTGIPLFDYTVKKTEENATGWTAQAMLKNPLYADLVTNRTYFNPETNQTESELSVSTLPQSTLIKAIQEQQEQIAELKTGKPKEIQQFSSIESGYQKINGSIILTLG